MIRLEVYRIGETVNLGKCVPLPDSFLERQLNNISKLSKKKVNKRNGLKKINHSSSSGLSINFFVYVLYKSSIILAISSGVFFRILLFK